MLRGAGGVAISLPLLECMLDGTTARAQTAVPKRYLVCFDGQSIGGNYPQFPDLYTPLTTGPNYDLGAAYPDTDTQGRRKVALKVLETMGNVKDEISVVTGLKIPWAALNGGTTPAGGRPDAYHHSMMGPLLSGVRASGTTGINGPTSDWVAAQTLGKDKLFAFRVQASTYRNYNFDGREKMTYLRGSTGNVVPFQEEGSPRAAFNRLFGTGTPQVDDYLLRSRRSVLDLVKSNTSALLPNLGSSDRSRIQLHLDEIRQLEARLIAPPAATCTAPTDPGADPAVSLTDQYGGEEERARNLFDIIHMAFVCDLLRAGSLMMTLPQAFISLHLFNGVRGEIHELGHGSSNSLVIAKGVGWHVRHFGYFVSKLRDTAEAGGKLIDNTVAILVHEGGNARGYDPELNRTQSAHTTENMAALIAGRAGGLKPGQHVAAAGQHPAKVLITGLRAVGVTSTTLGEVQGEIPGLRA